MTTLMRKLCLATAIAFLSADSISAQSVKTSPTEKQQQVERMVSVLFDGITLTPTEKANARNVVMKAEIALASIADTASQANARTDTLVVMRNRDATLGAMLASKEDSIAFRKNIAILRKSPKP
jgi:hypothetical protein